MSKPATDQKRHPSRPTGATVFALLVSLASLLAPPLGARERMSPPTLLPEIVTEAADRAIDRGLEYLSAQQEADGSFSALRYKEAYPTAISSLVGLAFLAQGSTPTRGPYARQLQGITNFLLNECATPTGMLQHQRHLKKPMYGHAFAMTYLAQVSGMEPDPARRKRIRDVLDKAVELTVQTQTHEGSWGYEPDWTSEDEGTLTVTQMQALRACRDAGFLVGKQTIDNAVRYLKDSTNDSGSRRGAVRYRLHASSGTWREGVTCAAVVTLINAGEHDHPLFPAITEFVDAQILPVWEGNLRERWRYGAGRSFGRHAEYILYYLAQAMYFRGGLSPRDDERWRSFYTTMSEKLVIDQDQRDGSWGGAESQQFSRTYSTAIALLVLQLPLSRLPVYKR